MRFSGSLAIIRLTRSLIREIDSILKPRGSSSTIIPEPPIEDVGSGDVVSTSTIEVASEKTPEEIAAMEETRDHIKTPPEAVRTLRAPTSKNRYKLVIGLPIVLVIAASITAAISFLGAPAISVFKEWPSTAMVRAGGVTQLYDGRPPCDQDFSVSLDKQHPFRHN